MVEASHAELVRRIYEAFAVSDLGALAEAFADDVEMIQVGNSRLGGKFHGRAAMLGHFADIGRFTDGLRMEPYDIVAGDGEHVAALNTMTIEKMGISRVFRVIHLFRIARGKVVELRSVPEDPYALDAFVG